MREGMRRTICAVYVKSWENRLYYGKHNRIAQFSYENVSRHCGEAKSIPIYEAGVGFFCAVQYIISVKDSEGIMLGSAHASTTYGMW